MGGEVFPLILRRINPAHGVNPDTQRFCGECGTKLERVCPNCSANNPYQYKFCGECGSDLRQSIETPPGEDVEGRQLAG